MKTDKAKIWDELQALRRVAEAARSVLNAGVILAGHYDGKGQILNENLRQALAALDALSKD